MSGRSPDAAGRADNAEVRLERPGYDEFEKALVGIGIGPNDASRLSRHCGRSWTVFRRLRSPNPSIRRPRWLAHPSATSLSTICLVGGWSSNHEADRNSLSVLREWHTPRWNAIWVRLGVLMMRRSFVSVESGSQSALELLALFGDRITDDQLDAFFSAVEDVLSAPDPQLELPDEKRYAAAVHRKSGRKASFCLIRFATCS